jgi:hypothetical protein
MLNTIKLASARIALGLTALTLTPHAASALNPQQCYKRDVNCTKFCGGVKDPDWQHECFMRCNIYLDNCLGTGVWTDQSKAVLSPDSDTGGPQNPRSPIGKLAPITEAQ